MLEDPLTQVLALLLASVLVVTLARRVGMPPVLGYLVVGVLVGPFSFGLVPESEQTHLLADIGVVFLLFTLGLEFSWPRMVAMRREVFGLGLLQVVGTTALFLICGRLLGLSWLAAVVVGGALSMSSTAIVIRQLTEQAEINRTHGRLTFAILLFQDLAFVPLLALATALAEGVEAQFSFSGIARTLASGFAALLIVMLAGRWLLRPLFMVIAHSRLKELFTLTVLFVVLASAWITEHAGLSLALGGFLAGMMLAETEYRHQVEAVIRPFRELLLGLFFISVGMLLNLGVLYDQFLLVSITVLGMVLIKVASGALAVRGFVSTNFKALRTGMLLGGGGEFGVALLTLLIQAPTVPNEVVQPLLLALVVTMLVAPFGIRYNKTFARLLLRERGPPQRAIEREEAATSEVARREHVVLCGFGRVGQNIARVLESQGFEYIAVDLDLARVRPARQAGYPVIFGDSTDEDVLHACGLATASAVVVSFANPEVSVGIVRAVREQRADVPVLVRTADDVGIAELTAAGATEVVPETFEASLMLVSQVLMLLNVPAARVVRTVGKIRRDRYVTLRDVVPADPRFRRCAGRAGRGNRHHRDSAAGLGSRPATGRCARTWRRSRIHGPAPTGHFRSRTSRFHRAAWRRCPAGIRHAEAIEHAEAILLTG